MADERVFLIAWLKPKPGREDEMAELLRGMCAPSRAEAGCIFYNLYRATDEAGGVPFHRVLEIAGRSRRAPRRAALQEFPRETARSARRARGREIPGSPRFDDGVMVFTIIP